MRNITWNVENPRNFVDQKRGKPVDGMSSLSPDLLQNVICIIGV